MSTRPKYLSVMVMALFAFSMAAARAEETVWLSSLDLSKATQGFGKPQADKSVDGHPLTLKGQTYAHGFGTHSPGLLVIQLNGARRFQATVGIDDEVSSGKGSAEFQVRGDGDKILWRSGILRQGQPPKNVDVDLTGVRQIVLHVTTGGDGYDFDHADWTDARFGVTGPKPETVVWKPAASDPVIAMIAAPAVPHIHPPFVVDARPGQPFVWAVPVSGARPLTFSASHLPHGLMLDPVLGTITGTLPLAIDYPVKISVKNGAGSDSQIIDMKAGDTMARTPPMGWNSYDAYGDNVSETALLANARYLRENMQPYGWQYVVVDYRWYDPDSARAPDNGAPGETLALDANGRLLPAPNRFPSAGDGHGFQALAGKLHAMGLRFGIHIMRGIPRNAVKPDLPIAGSASTCAQAARTTDTCGWCPDMYGVRGDTPAGQAYYDSLFRLYASWGVDYVKMDDTSAPYHTDEIEAVRKAIDRCGRAIVYSLSPGETPIEQGAHVAAHANLWRVSGDFWDGWTALDHEFTLGERWHDFAGPGHWPDADMLPLGHISLGGRPVGPDRRTNFTKSEQMTLMSLWALLPAPLMVGANLPDNDPWTLALLTNPEVLAVDQDALGQPAIRASHQDDTEVWGRALADGSQAVGLFNRGDFAEAVTASQTDLKLSGAWTVRDLWQRKDVGRLAGKFEATVPAHGVVLLRLTREKNERLKTTRFSAAWSSTLKRE